MKNPFPKTEKNSFFLYFLAVLLSLSFINLFVLFRHYLPAVPDAMFYCYPDQQFNLSVFQQGFIPLWNPFIACGSPHLADWSSSVFYFPDWIVNWNGSSKDYMIFPLAHILFAFIGFFLWLRSQGIETLWSVLFGLVYVTSGHWVQCWGLLPLIATASFIPWVFWALQKALYQNHLKWWFLASLFLGMQLLAGYPFFVFYTWLTFTLWFLFQKPSGPVVLRFALALWGALVLSSVQWLPFLDFCSYGIRSFYSQNLPYFDRPAEFLTLLQPDILGFPGRAGYPGAVANWIFGDLYLGVIPLILWLSSFLRWNSGEKQNRFWSKAALLILFVMACLNFSIPKGALYSLLDLINPSKAVCVFIFAALTSAALSLNSFFQNASGSKKNHWVWIIALFIVVNCFWTPARLLHLVANPYESRQYEDSAGKVRLLAGSHRILSLKTGSLRYNLSDFYETSSMDPILSFLPNTNMVSHVRSAGAYLTFSTSSFNELNKYLLKGYPYEGDLLDIADVGLLLLPQSLNSQKFKTVGKLDDNFLIVNQRASGSMLYVPDSIEKSSRPEILYALANPKSLWRQKVYLEKNEPGLNLSLEPARRNLTLIPAEGFQRPAGSRASFSQNFPAKGFVTFNESCVPGWHAWLDGKPEPIMRAYGLFMAVALPESGLHQVDFRYEPTSFRLGAFISLLSLGLLGFCGMNRLR
jgi:hypothetical protein